jgi:hypothetical protein
MLEPTARGITLAQHQSPLEQELVGYLPNIAGIVSKIVSKLIKPTGARFTVLYSNNVESTANFLDACETQGMGVSDYGFLVAGDGFMHVQNQETYKPGLLSSGVLYIVEDGLESATSYEEMLLLVFR